MADLSLELAQNVFTKFTVVSHAVMFTMISRLWTSLISYWKVHGALGGPGIFNVISRFLCCHMPDDSEYDQLWADQVFM